MTEKYVYLIQECQQKAVNQLNLTGSSKKYKKYNALYKRSDKKNWVYKV